MAVITPVDYSGLNGGMSKLASAMAGGDPEIAMGYAKNQAMAQHFSAEAKKVNIDNQRNAQFNDPAQVNKLTALLKGGSEADVPLMQQFQKTGRLDDGVFQTGTDALFAPVVPKVALPSLADSVAPIAAPTKLMQGFTDAPKTAPVKTLPMSADATNRIQGMTQLAAQMQALGDKAATGDNLTQMQSYFQAMHSGLTGTALQNAINAAAKGTQQEFKIDTNGVLVNSGSGQVSVGEQGIYNSELSQNKAKIAKDYADAEHNRALAHEASNGGKWQTMDTTNGLVQVNQQGDVRPLGIQKPTNLKPIPPHVNEAFIANSQAGKALERALTLLDGNNIGNPNAGGLAGDANATGYKGYLPNAILNRMDPQGVATRAQISDIGSLKIHDRSGAAVTISESPRLMPFIPLASDDAATVRVKLKKLAIEVNNESGALHSIYSAEQGYRPNPLADTSQALPADAPSGKGLNIGMVVDGHTYQGGNPNDAQSWR